jgi:hypothetical protein
LLEEKRNVLRSTLLSDGSDPVLCHSTRSRTTFAADDNPMDAAQIHRPKIFQKRFYGQESDFRMCSAQLVNPRQTMLPVFNADPHQMCEASAAFWSLPRNIDAMRFARFVRI